MKGALSMYQTNSKQFFCASANSAAASFSCANLSIVLDAALLASILFSLAVLGLHSLGVLVVLVSILRISLSSGYKPESLA